MMVLEQSKLFSTAMMARGAGRMDGFELVRLETNISWTRWRGTKADEQDGEVLVWRSVTRPGECV